MWMVAKVLTVQIFLLIGIVLIKGSDGHGMVLDPVNRASRWRYNVTAIIDYEDNGVTCGGYELQHFTNKGKCGFCGDNYADPLPREHELGGKYGEGIISKVYTRGQIFKVLVRITANHMRGHFEFKFCNLDIEGKESDECFERDEVFLYKLRTNDVRDFLIKVPLPDYTCKRCVLQWTYIVANQWGLCKNGIAKLGCGPQEHFRTCSDFSIVDDKNATKISTKLTTKPAEKSSTGAATKSTKKPLTRYSTKSLSKPKVVKSEVEVDYDDIILN